MIAHKNISPDKLRFFIKNGQIQFAGHCKLKIYGQLKCSSGRRMALHHRVFFSGRYEAETLGYRPCARCMQADYVKWKTISARTGLSSRPVVSNFEISKINTFMIVTNTDKINYDRIEKAIRYLEENFLRQPELDEIAERVHVSPFHFQRMFTEWAGISPKRFLQFLTVDYLKEKLAVSRNLTEAAEAAGLSSQSRVYDLFTTLEAVTPQEYKQSGGGIQIEYGLHETTFGNALIGVTDRGVCWLSFVPSDGEPKLELEMMKEHWHNSVFHQNQSLTLDFINRIFPAEPLNHPKKLHVLVKGTNFQVKVWEALLKIPMGQVTTYQQIAELIESPRAMQAVGSAVGSNHIAYLIPCHRVIRKDGILGEYRWSAARKKSIIGWEMAKAS